MKIYFLTKHNMLTKITLTNKISEISSTSFLSRMVLRPFLLMWPNLWCNNIHAFLVLVTKDGLQKVWVCSLKNVPFWVPLATTKLPLTNLQLDLSNVTCILESFNLKDESKLVHKHPMALRGCHASMRLADVIFMFFSMFWVNKILWTICNKFGT